MFLPLPSPAIIFEIYVSLRITLSVKMTSLRYMQHPLSSRPPMTVIVFLIFGEPFIYCRCLPRSRRGTPTHQTFLCRKTKPIIFLQARVPITSTQNFDLSQIVIQSIPSLRFRFVPSTQTPCDLYLRFP